MKYTKGFGILALFLLPVLAYTQSVTLQSVSIPSVPSGGAPLAVDSYGNLSMPFGTATAPGALAAGTGLNVSAGIASVAYGIAANTAAQGNDGRIVNAASATSVTSAINSAIPSIATSAPACGSGAAGAVAACGSATVVPNNSTTNTQSVGTNNTTIATQAAVIQESGFMLFGAGTDGNVTISSGTTTITRDMCYNNLTLNGTGVINPNGYRILVAGTLDISAARSGAITLANNNGASASGSTGGSAGAYFIFGGTVPTGVGNGSAAPSGGTGVGTAGAAQGNGNSFPIIAALGGSGGAGGAGTNAGGTGGTPYSGLTLLSDGNNLYFPVPTPFPTFAYLNNAVKTFSTLQGSPGGAGGGDGTNSGGGAGQGSGAQASILIFARTIQRGTNTNTNIISLTGPLGGNGGSSSAGNTGGGGGGGGGPGGWVYIVTENLLGSTIANAVNVSGGTGGNGGNGYGTGKGGTGGTGGASGNVQILNLGAPSFTVSTFGAAGTTPSAATTTSGTAGGAGATLQVNL